MSVIAQVGDFRVRVVLDDSPSEPYDDGATPLLRIWRGEVVQVEDVTSYRVPAQTLSAVREAVDRWDPTGETFARYPRLFHGASNVVTYGSNRDGVYGTFDTPHWREAMGLTEEHIAAHGIDVTALANLDEWRAYCEGEVYGWVVERRELWRKDGDPTVTRETWEEVEAVWGYYSHRHAVDNAREALQAHVEKASAGSGRPDPD